MNDSQGNTNDAAARGPGVEAWVFSLSPRHVGIASGCAVGLLWLAQPPFAFWPLAMVALVPWLWMIEQPGRLKAKTLLILWACSSLFYLVSLQGLRHAHPLMFLPWIALSCYLAIYHVGFVVTCRYLHQRRWPLGAAAPLMWVGQECIRNYFLTGISALMLGHTLAGVPQAIQIADLFGSYGVGLVIVAVNVALYEVAIAVKNASRRRSATLASLAALALVISTLTYGHYRLGQPLGTRLDTFALIQRGEEVLYEQSDERALEIFQNYTQQSVEAIRTAERAVDVVVWPESMFSAGLPWMFASEDAVAPPEANLSNEEFRQNIQTWQQAFQDRARYLQQSLLSTATQTRSPHLLVGCGVVEYAESPSSYSGIVSITPEGRVDDWYGKTHLVMFGEYIPIAPRIPLLRSLIPPGMGLDVGPGGQRMQAGSTAVAPAICIETAVERVVVNQLDDLRAQNEPIDAVVTVTNDGWFDDSSVIEHHLRCSVLVAVATRRPILSAANNGPTAWIDSNGRVVERLATGANDAILATPQEDDRHSLYVQIGDWPARACGLLFVWMLGSLMLPGRYRKQIERIKSCVPSTNR